MKKTCIKRFTSFLMAAIIVISFSLPCLATSIPNTIVYSSDRNSSIEYIADENRFHIVNIAPEKILDAFDSCEAFSIVEDKAESYSTRATNALTNRTYSYSVYATGIYGEAVEIVWMVIMQMSQMNINGTNYDYFVDVFVGPTASLMSGSYSEGPGWSDVGYSITANGSTLTLGQIVQLEYASTTSIDISANALWMSLGGSISDTYFYRSRPQSLSRVTVLPIYNAIY